MRSGVADSGRTVDGLVEAQQLREATLSWLHGLDALGTLLSPHNQGRPAPWAVQVDHDWITVAHARPGVLDDDIVVRTDLAPKPAALGYFHRQQGTFIPHGRLARWMWARDPLARQLASVLRKRALPVTHTSPLATERAWFLAQEVMCADRGFAARRQIPFGDLSARLAPLMDQVRSTVRSRWKWGRHTIDSDDVRWLDEHIRQRARTTSSPPRPPADRTVPDARFVWPLYSPELARSITADVLRDALIGYRDLVERNFARFGAALGLYSILPVRVDGFMITPADKSEDPPTVVYTLRRAPEPRRLDEPIVEIAPSRADAVHELPWTSLRDDDPSSAFHRPGVVEEDAFLPWHDR